MLVMEPKKEGIMEFACSLCGIVGGVIVMLGYVYMYLISLTWRHHIFYAFLLSQSFRSMHIQVNEGFNREKRLTLIYRTKDINITIFI